MAQELPDWSFHAASGQAVGQLLKAMDSYAELTRETAEPDPVLAEMEALNAIEADDFVLQDEVFMVSGIHTGNIISCCQQNDKLITASADKTIASTPLTGLPDSPFADTSQTTKLELPSPVLNVLSHPSEDLLLATCKTFPVAEQNKRRTLHRNHPSTYSQHLHSTDNMQSSNSNVFPPPPWLILAGMDGSTWLLRNTDRLPGPKHSKYVVRCAWSTDGHTLATASYDKTVAVWRRAGSDQPFEPLKVLPFVGNPEALEFTMVADRMQEQLLVGVRDDCHLHMYDTATWACDKMNLNKLKDHFVSFTVMDVRVDPSSRYVAIATDKDRVLVYSLATQAQLRVLYGASNDGYSNPRLCWHPSSAYILATSQTHDIVCWDIRSEAIAFKLSGHEALIRALVYDEANKMLITCSYDKTVRLWK
eukprot:TRINITY_DN6245_c0_g1_i1.p1 TRINITY_DN6245_c0_g1~~TRINITY_DN6245_c0_g1_i1.p1  ORF type:complete len:449 (+),score=99.73 TRINITY_DN6245_c0_g1_i1:90-1349(+)